MLNSLHFLGLLFGALMPETTRQEGIKERNRGCVCGLENTPVFFVIVVDPSAFEAGREVPLKGSLGQGFDHTKH